MKVTPQYLNWLFFQAKSAYIPLLHSITQNWIQLAYSKISPVIHQQKQYLLKLQHLSNIQTDYLIDITSSYPSLFPSRCPTFINISTPTKIPQVKTTELHCGIPSIYSKVIYVQAHHINIIPFIIVWYHSSIRLMSIVIYQTLHYCVISSV